MKERLRGEFERLRGEFERLREEKNRKGECFEEKYRDSLPKGQEIQCETSET